MDMNSLQGTTPYTNTPGTTLPVDNTQLRDQNSETTKTDIGNETTNEAQTAFTVEITPEAQNILAAQQPIETQPRATESQQTTQDMAQASRSGNIINLTA